jgi:hypothetical protein
MGLSWDRPIRAGSIWAALRARLPALAPALGGGARRAAGARSRALGELALSTAGLAFLGPAGRRGSDER